MDLRRRLESRVKRCPGRRMHPEPYQDDWIVPSVNKGRIRDIRCDPIVLAKNKFLALQCKKANRQIGKYYKTTLRKVLETRSIDKKLNLVR